ncbi:MAG: NAD(P)-binding domain-containing protein [Pseudomonadota bacterium]
MENANLVIVGAGPAGIAAAVEAKLAGLSKVIILEKADHICDTMVRLYHEGKRVDPVFMKMKVDPIGALSFDTESREESLDRMAKVVADHSLDVRFKHEVRKITQINGHFKVEITRGEAFRVPVVLVALGVFGRPVKPKYQIPKEVAQKVLFGMPAQPPQDKTVLVVGGGDSAAETACFLCGASTICLSYRQPEFFRINPVNMCNLENGCKEGRITLMMNTDIVGLQADNDRVKAIFNDGREMSYDFVTYCLGGSTPEAFLRSVGVEIEDKRPKISEDGEANIKGIFLAGDLAAPKGSIMWAFNSAKKSIDGIVKKYGSVLA